MAGAAYDQRMARRAWGGGSLYRHGDGWRVAFSLGKVNGKRIRRERQFASRRAAEAWLRQGRRGPLPLAEGGLTVAAHAAEWLTGVEHSVRPSTFAFYGYMAKHVIDDENIGHLPLSRLTPADVRAVMAVRHEEGYSPRTIRGIVDILRMILRQAVGDGLLARNVAELVKRPQLDSAEPAHFTAEQAQRFLDAARTDPLYSLFAVALGTGCRRGELLGLTWRDIPDGSAIVIRRSKTDAGLRLVPLPEFARDALAALPRKPGPIWPVSPWWVTRKTALLCERAGLPRLTTHGLRHTAMTLMAEAGVSLEVRRWIAGHSRTDMTAFYSHENDAAKRDAAERLEGILAGHGWTADRSEAAE